MSLPAPESRAVFLERCLCIKALFDCSQTSGARTIIRNASVGGNAASKHLLSKGSWAEDIVPDENTPQMRAEIVRAIKKLGMWCLDESDHIHIQGKAPGG